MILIVSMIILVYGWMIKSLRLVYFKIIVIILDFYWYVGIIIC